MLEFVYLCYINQQRIIKVSPKFRQEDGFVFKIYSNEEERMHIHVVKAENFGFSSRELKKITEIVANHGNEFKTSMQNTSVAVLMINSQGMMLSVQGHDYFVSYNRMPWMRDARISSVLNVQMCGRNAIEWPDLDVDLEIESLKHPERHPLIMKRHTMDVVD